MFLNNIAVKNSQTDYEDEEVLTEVHQYVLESIQNLNRVLINVDVMIRSEEGLVGMRSMQDQCTVSVWNTDTILNKACNSVEALLTYKHKNVADIQASHTPI